MVCEKGKKEGSLKYIRAPLVNSYQINKTLTNRNVITEIYIRASRCGYKLLGAMIEKNNANQIINEYGSNTLFKRT